MAYQLPQELVDTIVTNVEDVATLRVCSRINQSWTTPSQRILFNTVCLASSRYKFLSQGDLVSRFHRTLCTSPHLAHHVRILELDPSQVVPSKTEPLFTRLTRLQEVRVVDFQDAPMFTCPKHHPFHTLLSLPDVSRLRIGPGAWYLGDVMPCLRSGQNIKELTLEDIVFEGHGYGLCTAYPRLPGIELEQLSIERGFVGLLAALQNMPGIDLGRLKNLSVLLGVRNAQTSMRWRNRVPIQAISECLKANVGTLEHLALDVVLEEPLCEIFDASRLRSLSLHVRWHVAEQDPGVWLQWIASSFEGISEPSMMEEFILRVTTYDDDEVPDLGEDWARLDKALSRATMSRLTRVVIEQDGEDEARVGATSFPLLCKKGVSIEWL